MSSLPSHVASVAPPVAGLGTAPAAPAGGPEQSLLHDLLRVVLQIGGSDLHLTAGSRPLVRLHGSLQPVEGAPQLTPALVEQLLWSHLAERDRARFAADGELDTAYSLSGWGRFRVNVFRQRGSLAAVFRAVPSEVPTLERLGLPETVRRLAELPRGLVLVTGPTGSGKSTTLASMVDHVNRTRAVHIMTVEDPIEFLHPHRRSVVNQREVGSDTADFPTALRHVLRQDPDVILIGEMRDLDTIQIALTAAETGHLVFATLHTQSAAQTVHRIIDVFPPAQQSQVRSMVASTLQGVVAQQLVPTADGRARVAAVEILVATSAVRNMIREGKVHQLGGPMQAGRAQGMVTMDAALAALVQAGRITVQAALERASDESDLRQQLA